MQTLLAASLSALLAFGVLGCDGGGSDAGSDGGPDHTDAAGDPDAALSPSSIPDPAPERTEPGEYGCEGCPDTDIAAFELEAGAVTSTDFDGVVTGADGNGIFWIGGPDGRALAGPIPTAEDGTFSFDAPLFCGEQLVKCLWSNDAGTYVLVTRVVTTDCVEPDIRLTISWDEAGQDWELHLIKPGGQLNDPASDCTWNTCTGGGQDWGVVGDPADNPRKDVDDTGTYGPENIFLARPEDGTYTVMVEHWGSGTPSTGQAIFNVAGRSLAVPMTGLESHHVWKVGTIDWPSGVIAPTDEVIDCTADWSSGCQLPLP